MALILLGISAWAQEENRYYTIGLGPIDPSDTLRFCWADIWTEEGQRAVQLFQLYSDLYAKRMAYIDSQMTLEQENNGELDQLLSHRQKSDGYQA